ncbi:unnamed protein product [Thelazia callipaeda]|uniref:HAUS6_N domain-containing protein n=1 Tax=Thelazia callipaeda TaxID=103827 RepID=A0A0N5D1X5_THECL|nr:unnamed protein product [Thelazia callipaeda]
MSTTEVTLAITRLKSFLKNFEQTSSLKQSVDFARLTAAYYLGFPLFTSKIPGSLPSLYEWPKSVAVLQRNDIAKTISSVCDERLPPMLLWRCNHRIEAIYYSDHFRDFKSQALLRFLEEHISGIGFLQEFCESRIDTAFKELDRITEKTDEEVLQNLQFSWNKLADSLLQMDAITETSSAKLLHNKILCKMFNINATMPLFVDSSIVLPRLPVYIRSSHLNAGIEHSSYAQLWILIQSYAYLLSAANVLLPCIQYFYWSFIKFNSKYEIPNSAMVKAEYISHFWSYPTYNTDEHLIAMNLKLRPSDFVCTTNCSKQNKAISSRKSAHLTDLDANTCCYSVSDITSRNVHVTNKHEILRNSKINHEDPSSIDKIDLWGQLNDAYQKVNNLIGEVEKEIKETSRYVRNLLKSKKKEFTKSEQNLSNMVEYNVNSVSTDQSVESDSTENGAFINNDQFLLDSNREPESHPEIEKLDFSLLSPQPFVRNPFVKKAESEVTMDSSCSTNTLSALPAWLKLLPTKHKNFLLSLAPDINQIEDSIKSSTDSEVQLLQMETPKVKQEKNQIPPKDLKFEFITTIASNPLYNL